jgi:hypothetical protein
MLALGTLALGAATVARAQDVTTLFVNGNVYTLNEQGALRHFSAFAVQGDQFVAVGGHELEKTYASSPTVDLKGRTVLPGLTDAHGHVMGLGASLLTLDLRGVRSEAEAALMVKGWAARLQPGEWIIGRGWNQELWPNGAFPHKKTLDEVSGDHPVWLERVDGHAGWANSRALMLAGIDRTTRSPEGGLVLRDDKGEPTGILVDNATSLITKHIPPADDAYRRKAFLAAQEHLLGLGITAVHDAGIDAATYRLYRQMKREGLIRLRIYAMLSASDPELPDMLKQGVVGAPGDWLYIRSVKAYADGALGSRGAALLAPYSDAPDTSGLLLTPEKTLRQQLLLSHAAGFQFNVHAIGDRANRMVLDIFETALSRADRLRERPRIEHAQIVAPTDIPRFARLHVLPSMQPVHATSDKEMAEKRLGKQRLAGAYAWRKLLNTGAIIPAGTDFPVELANPFHTWYAATTRQDLAGLPPGGWLPGEVMTSREIFAGMTSWAAYASFSEHVLGRVAPGYKADFIVTDQDPFAARKQKIPATKVLETWTGGRQRVGLSH